MHDLLDVDPRAVVDQITVLRIGHSANIELFQYEAPGQSQTHPRNSDWSGHHIAFYVTDIDPRSRTWRRGTSRSSSGRSR